MQHTVEEALGARVSFEIRHFNALLNAFRESIVITTAALEEPGPTIIFVNAGFEAMTGYQSSDVLGSNPRMFQGTNTSRLELDRMRASLKAGLTFEGTTVNYRKDGSEFQLRWAIVPIFDDFGRKVAWLSLQSEEKKLVQAALEPQALMLQMAVRASEQPAY